MTVFWGGREGYQTILNTDVKRELDHMAALFHMAVGMVMIANRQTGRWVGRWADTWTEGQTDSWID